MIKKLIPTALSYAEKYDYDILYLNTPIKTDLEFDVYEQLKNKKLHKNVLLILITYGGSGNSAYKTMRLLQENYTHVDLIAPSFCNSAGTMMATGARKIYMTELSEFGPIDGQMLVGDGSTNRISELALKDGIRSIGKYTTQLFETFYDNLSNDYALFPFDKKVAVAENLSKTFTKSISKKIKPEELGKNLRQLHESRDYCCRLNEKYENMQDGGY